MSRIKGAPSFWDNVNKTDGCWEWTSQVNNKGYGILTGDGQIHMAHRCSWMIHKGPIPKGLFVLHKCDNRRCVNPDHLFLGTHEDNMRDMVAKKRQAVGSKVASSKLTEEAVRQIRALRQSGMKYREIAEAFGLSTYHVKDICHRRYWTHVI